MMCGELSDERIECLESLPEQQKATHLISGDTDNAEELDSHTLL